MRYILEVQFLTPDITKLVFSRELFRQSMEVDSALSFDYQKVVDAFLTLFLNWSIFVQFTISNF